MFKVIQVTKILGLDISKVPIMIISCICRQTERTQRKIDLINSPIKILDEINHEKTVYLKFLLESWCFIDSVGNKLHYHLSRQLVY